MDMQTYKTKALRTASEQFYGNQVPKSELDDALHHLEGQIGEIDALKKGLFYGKSYPGFSPKKGNEKTWEGVDKDLLHAGLGLMTEGFEFLEKVLNIGTPKTDDDRAALLSELGDSLWYANIATRPLDVDLDKVADLNITKLFTRFPERFSAEQAIDKDVQVEDGTIKADLITYGSVSAAVTRGWLIEHLEVSSEATRAYFVAEVGKPSWTANPDDALWFSREVDAKNFASVYLPGNRVRISEH